MMSVCCTVVKGGWSSLYRAVDKTDENRFS